MRTTYRKWHTFPAVPRYLVPVARSIKSLHEIVRAGVIIESPAVIVELLPDGRNRLRTGARTGGGSAGTGSVLARTRPTTLNQVIAAGTLLGLWPTNVSLATPATLNEVITAGILLHLWPTLILATPATLNQVIAAGTVGLWPSATTLNQVIAAGTALGLWPATVPVTPTTLNEVISAGTSLGLWPRPALLTPTTLNEVISAGAALNLWA